MNFLKFNLMKKKNKINNKFKNIKKKIKFIKD